MNRIFRKIPMLMIVLLGVCSMSITAFAYYAYNYGVDVSAIQTAEYAVYVSIPNKEAESNLTSYTFSGSEGEEGVTFSLTAAGTETAVGYCEIIFKEQSYYTRRMEAGSSGMVVVKADAGDTVRFVSHWGVFDVPAGAVLISGEDYVIDARETAEASEATEATEATEPTEESSEVATTEPTEEPSEETTTKPSSEASEATTAE